MTQTTQPSARTRLTRTLAILGSIVLIGAVMWQLLPKGSFSNDLTRVGQGQPALVMLREVHVMGGDLVMEQMLHIHPEFENTVEFLVVHTGHPDGQAFARDHNISDGSLVLFDGNGEVLGRRGRPESPDALRQFIANLLES
ncbi:hypothetical protein E3V39_01490 [Gammaproteobacteria bacterium LSUCC0112]|nr:hypothetical protein E3V39_01490 [Gammaproteobacteria bacterium LSUCC0112]